MPVLLTVHWQCRIACPTPWGWEGVSQLKLYSTSNTLEQYPSTSETKSFKFRPICNSGQYVNWQNNLYSNNKQVQLNYMNILHQGTTRNSLQWSLKLHQYIFNCHDARQQVSPSIHLVFDQGFYTIQSFVLNLHMRFVYQLCRPLIACLYNMNVRQRLVYQAPKIASAILSKCTTLLQEANVHLTNNSIKQFLYNNICCS